MGYIAIGVLVLTGVAIIFGTLFGMGRGRNRSILRLILIIGCVLGAYFLRGTVTEIIMGIDTGEGTLAEMMASSLGGEGSFPEGLQNFVVSLIEILIGLIAYFLVFFALRFVTWILIYPICKIFVKKELVKKKGLGALIGLVQGVIVAFAVLAPASGLISTVGVLTKMEMEGEPMLAVEKEIGLEDYKDSFIGKTYLTIGGWYYELVAPSLDGSANAMVSMMGVAKSLQDFSGSMEIIKSTQKTSQQKADELKGLGNSLKEVGAQIEELSDGAEEILNNLLSGIGDMMGGEMPPEMVDFFNNLKVSDLDMTALGDAIYNIGEYFEKTDVAYTGLEQFSQEDANAIVNGFVQNDAIMSLLEKEGTVEQLIDISNEYESLFATAINNAPEGTDKAALKTLLGIA